MRSSTFSSSVDYPKAAWLKTWLLALTFAGTLLLGWEAVLRSLGHRPTVVDDEALWSLQRDRVYSRRCKAAVVLLGDCRMQFGLMPQVLQEKFPRYSVAELAVQGTSPVAALRDLATDERFCGVVICALNERLLCQDMWDTQQAYVDYYRTQYTFSEKLNRLISTAVQRTLVVVHPQLRLDDLLVHVAKHRCLPAPYYLQTRADRSRLGDYGLVDLQAHREWILARVRQSYTSAELPSPARWLNDAMRLEPYVQAIQARDGRVIFVRFPTSGKHLEYDEQFFPKDEYWDVFAAQTSALCIHFKDLPQLSAFACPDTSHLDRRDAPRFTLALAGVLEDRGVFRDPPCATTMAAQCRCHRPCLPGPALGLALVALDALVIVPLVILRILSEDSSPGEDGSAKLSDHGFQDDFVGQIHTPVRT